MEYQLRDFLRNLGWTADRVPCSGAAQGFKGDIKARKYERDVLFEMKARKSSFKNIYAIFKLHRDTTGDDVLSFVLPGERIMCVDISDSPNAFFDEANTGYTLAKSLPYYSQYKRTFGQIENLEKLLQSAEILVLKDDRMPLIFLRYRK